MPLLDHFHPPLYPRHRWHGFHNAWATYLAAALNETLPAEYFAEPNVQFGIEIDTAVLREERVVYEATSAMATENGGMNGKPSGSKWQPTWPSQTIAFEQSADVIEVLVYTEDDGPTLVGRLNWSARPKKIDRRNPLTIGQELPTMPLWLRNGPCLPVLLEATYMRTCHEQRIPTDFEVL